VGIENPAFVQVPSLLYFPEAIGKPSRALVEQGTRWRETSACEPIHESFEKLNNDTVSNAAGFIIAFQEQGRHPLP